MPYAADVAPARPPAQASQRTRPSRFAHPSPALQTLAGDVLQYAKTLGASDCEVDVSEGFGQSVTVRRGDIESIEYNRDKGVGITVYLGARKGYASTSNFSSTALRETVGAALNIARFTAEDPCAGLPEESLLATREDCARDLDLYHPWRIGIEEAIDMARRCEQSAFAVSPQITNSEGATISVQEAHFVAANSRGFMGGYPSSRHYVSCSERPGRGFDRPGRRDGGNPGDRGGWGAQPPMERTTPAPAQN